MNFLRLKVQDFDNSWERGQKRNMKSPFHSMSSQWSHFWIKAPSFFAWPVTTDLRVWNALIATTDQDYLSGQNSHALNSCTHSEKHGRKSCQPLVAFICICLLLLLAEFAIRWRRRQGRFRNISSCTADDQYHEGNLSIPCKSSLRHGLEVGMRETRLCLSCNMGFVGAVHGANHG